MARTIETILRDYLGDQVLQMAKLSADLEAAREEIAALKAKDANPPPAKPNGRDRAIDPIRAPGA